ncbi:hypothetical protein HDV01_007759 [Terramyces sp. JEL0728]|nr:hypothetical protein HDV01_007759 [Terramyces sp. JEL0728]
MDIENTRRPSDYIKARQTGKYCVFATNDNIPPEVIALVDDTENIIQNCKVPFERPLFQPEPSSIRLEYFSPFKSYELLINFRNMDKVPRRLRIEESRSPYFSIHPWSTKSNQSDKVAPGMEIPYIIKFNPEENVDYSLNLVCVTEREQFVIPIKAIGARGILDLPDQILFQEVPAKKTSQRTLLVRNIGDCPAKFELSAEAPFNVSPESGCLGSGDAVQLIIEFTPKQIGSYSSKLLVKYESGDHMLVDLLGTAENKNIRLDKNNVKMENSISVTTSKSLKIINRSELMVKFSWKKCPNEIEEELLKMKRKMDLFKQEQIEIESLKQKKSEILDFSVVKQKFKNESRLFNDITYDFKDSCFTISPLEGVIWPNSFVEVNIHYRASKVGEQYTIAYCDIEGRETRLPLQLRGRAYGPKVKFSYTKFNVGEIFINTSHNYEILLENHGNISTKFSLQESNSIFGPKFKFTPSAGTIRVGEQILINVEFYPDILGGFREDFLWEIDGGSFPLNVCFDGSVIGPTFNFDVEKLIIPCASLGFLKIHNFQLNNTSLIPMKYKLKLKGLSDDEKMDFILNPSEGTIAEKSSTKLEIQFLPRKLQKYQGSVVVNVENVGNSLLTLPIEAHSTVPKVTIEKPVIALANCFLDYQYQDSIILVNDSDYWASFEMEERNSSRNTVYYYSFDVPKGTIPPHSTFTIQITVTIHRLGQINFPVFIYITGAREIPISLDISANGVGPCTSVSTNEIIWGNIPVLVNHYFELYLENKSPIPAEFNSITVGDSPVFKIEPVHGVIAAGEKINITVSAFLDDTIKFTDVLRINVASSAIHEILLSAKGHGSTIVFDESLKNVDFEDVFSNKECSTDFTIYNKGRRTQHLSWVHLPTKDPDILSKQIFEVIPNRFTLKPGAHQVIFIKGYSNVAAKINDKLICQTNTDKDPSRKVLIETNISVNFINPLVQVNPSFLKFNSTHTSDDGFKILEQTLALKNTTSLPLTVAFKCPQEFKLDEILPKILEPGQHYNIQVYFDPTHNLSRISSKESGKIQISYKEHPQKDYVELTSEVYFPNLYFGSSSLKFGCIQNDLEQRKTFQITNTSSLPVIYHWYFLEECGFDSTLIVQSFDIQPVSGTLEPGNSEEISVYFYGNPGKKISAKALCDVAGGPKYELLLEGESSMMLYSLDKQQIDFGSQPYQSIIEQDIMLSNDGLVDFDFKVIFLEKSLLVGKIMITPSSGRINSKCKEKITIKFCPCVPEDVKDSFFIQVADFEPAEIVVLAQSFFPRINFDIPRTNDESYSKILSSLQTSAQKVDIAFEADRQLLTVKTCKQLELLEKQYSEKIANHGQKHSYSGSNILYYKDVSGKSAKENKSHSIHEVSDILLCEYICDFGTVVKNSTTKKTFWITNSSNQPVSFNLNKSVLSVSGFTVEPEKVKNLPPGEKLEFTVIFSAKVDENECFLQLPVSIAGGPTVNINLKVAIAIPELKVSEDDTVDFGELLCGYRKSMVLQIENTTAVPCEWNSKLLELDMPSKKLKKIINNGNQYFDTVPSSGILNPYEKSVITIRFFPSEEKLFDIQLPFQINLNPKLHSVRILAKAVKPIIEFEPPTVIAGPILPFGEGSEYRVTLSNPNSHPIELFSVDFDTQYKQEEEILKQLEGYENGMIYNPPRDFTVSYYDYLLENQKRRQKLDKANLEDAKSSGHLDSVALDQKSNLQSNSVAQNPPSEVTVNSDLSSSILIHGPPFSGRTTQARKIAQHHNKAYLHIDEIVENSTAYLDYTNSEDTKLTTVKSEVQTAKSWDETKCLFAEELVCDLIRQKILKDENATSRGYVIDGLETKYCSNIPLLLKTIHRALLDKGRKLIIFHLILDYYKIKERETHLQNLLIEKELAILRVKELPEDEYDALSRSEKDVYDLAMQSYKKRVKEIEEKRHKERRHQEEELASKLGERKTADDQKAKSRRAGHSRNPTMDKPEKPFNTSQKPEKAQKKANSPKPARKTLDKGERHGDKESRHAEKNNEKDLFEENLSEESFIHELTFKRVELYASTLESSLAVLKEGKDVDKLNTAAKPTLLPPATTDKKPKVQKGIMQNEAPSVIPITDSESHSGEDPNAIEMHEIQVNNMDEETILKSMAEFIPNMPVVDDSQLQAKYHIESFIEQILKLPSEREKLPTQRVFGIYQFAPTPEIESEMHNVDGPTVATVSAAQKPTTDKIDAVKKKVPLKVSDEKGTDHEEEIEKELTPQTRWILQGGEKKDIVVKFNPTEPGKFEYNLKFESVGIPGGFTLPCRGLCQYSTIVTDIKKIFPKFRKVKEDKAIIQGEYVVATNTFEFGPLLQNKPREKYLEKFPENKATFNFINPTNTEIKVMFTLKGDIKSDVFFFDQQPISLLPGKSQSVAVWAYPRTATNVEDLFIVSIKDNPEPYIFKISCIGVKPELEVDKRTLNFEKLLLGRTEKREIRVRNPTLLPVAWRIAGIDSLGEEFTISPMEGQIESLQEVTVSAEFKAIKSLLIKKVLKLEVSDPEKIGGIVQEIPLLVTAEAYDIAMDVHFPKGFEGGLDFGTLKVLEDGKQLVTLKNKGKYEVGFRFLFDSSQFIDLLTITPSQGIIQPSEKPFFVQIVFKTASEISLKEFPVLKCIVFEPATGEVTASIPVRVSGRAVFSKSLVTPVRDLNFGALVHGTKSTKQFIIENIGEFDFKYSIFKTIARVVDPSESKRLSAKPSGRSRALSPPPAAKPINNKKELVKQTDTINFGAFTVFPTSGVVAAGTKQSITVDFHSEIPGGYEETIGIDVSDRSPLDYNDGMEYQLIGESCVPGINTTDFASIFEEQSVCKRLELFKAQNCVYGEEDRAFYYGAYLAGQQIQVHFKISNPFKVSCDVAIATKPRGKSKTEASDFAFDVEPKKLIIPSHEHRYVTVSFHPTSIQSYSGMFEAMVENLSEGKNKYLSFELRGEGTLPRVVIDKPILRSKTGAVFLKFKKLLVGTTQTIPLVIRNDGIIAASFKLEWVYKDNEDFYCTSLNDYQLLKPQESRSIEFKCQPSSVRKLEGELKLKVLDNNFEDTNIQVSGEGYVDDLTLEGFSEDSENELTFLDCTIGETRTHILKLKNHSNEWLKASFPELNDFAFSPANCHIRPRGGEREITVHFNPKQPLDLQHLPCIIKVSKIRLQAPANESDWDDRMISVKWVHSEQLGTKINIPKKVVESVTEPHFDIIGSVSDYHMQITGFADYSVYECDVNSIHFKSTLMFQNRVYRFPIRNAGKVSLKFNFDILDESGLDYSDIPFTIAPMHGKIPPGEMLMIAVRFSPTDVGEYKCAMNCQIGNLSKEQKPIQINIDGYSLRPFCHFELEDTDPSVLESRTPERCLQNGVPLSLEPNTKVIEFYSCGVKVKATKKFYIVNPTGKSYEYHWKMDSSQGSKSFKCLTLKGIVAPGKKSEIAFEFFSESLETKESLWSFSLPEHGIRIPFLLIGNALEPNIYIDHSGVNFKSVLVGRHVKEVVKLVNDEQVPFNFIFNDTSVETGANGMPMLKFQPTHGILQPKSETSIEILFSPPAEKLYNFNLVCNIKKKPTPVTINVKGEGYQIHDSLQVELADGSMFELDSDESAQNNLDFGVVQINEKRIKRVYIINSGKFNFDFSWSFAKKVGGITIMPEIGTVLKGERIYCEIAFLPTQSITLKDLKLACQILNGNLYTVSLHGTGTKPLVKVNPPALNFGTQFVYSAGMNPATSVIEITNNDVTEMTYDIISPEVKWLELQSGLFSLNPEETKNIHVTFYPRDGIVYNDTIRIEINGLSMLEIPVAGEGSELRIEADSQNANFGALRIGSSVTKTVKIQNKSKINTTFTLGPISTLLNLQGLGLQFSHPNEITLRPKMSVNVDIKFHPHRRIKAFSEEIFAEIAGNSKQLFIVGGACQGIVVELENDTLPFGAVVQKSFTTRRIQLQNVGDIGAKFSWDIQKFYPDFSISPSEGYISPGMEVPLEITFHPNELNLDIRAENIPCKIEGSTPLYLTLSGMCIQQPAQTDCLKFLTPVRTPEVKSIALTNKSSTGWHIRPIIENSYWSGPEIVDVEPGQSKSYDITFNPQETLGAGEGGRHEGSIFFPMPDGTGLLYKMNGVADKVLPSGNINREIPCKTLFTETLSISNWLRRSQRFKVVTEFAKPDMGVIFKGYEYVDLSPQLTKDYKFTFYAYKEGVTTFKVIFKNETTQEYIFFNVNYKCLPPGIISTLEFTSPIRQLHSREIVVSNPLPTPVVFTGSCNISEITIPHTFTIPPKSDFPVQVEFLPLQPKETAGRVILNSNELGTYQYDLKLNALPSGLERSLHFKVGLGGLQVQTFRFMSYAKTKTDYICKLDSPEFFVEKGISAPAATNGGVEISIEITYEPSRLGDTRTQLVISSAVGGDYVCPLFGHCTPPKPQGPIVVRPGVASALSFKNVFSTSATFNCVVDNPAFQIKATETIAPKKTISFSIGYKLPGANEKEKPGEKNAPNPATAVLNPKNPNVSKTAKLEGASFESQCHSISHGKKENSAKKYGSPESGCDSPIALIDVTHDGDSNIPRTLKETKEQNKLAVSYFRKAFSSKTIIIPSIGNNDVHPHNLLEYEHSTAAILPFFADIWSDYIPKAQMGNFLQHGSYVQDLSDSLRAVSLNTLYFSSSNRLIRHCGDGGSPGRVILEWLEKEVLKPAIVEKQKVFITGHIPPNARNFESECLDQFISLSLKYKDVIIGQFYGHMNIDHFYFPVEKTHPLGVEPNDLMHIMAPKWINKYFKSLLKHYKSIQKISNLPAPIFVTSSVCPAFNPGLRVYSYEKDSGHLLDYDHYYADLSEADHRKGHFYKLEYQAKNEYKLISKQITHSWKDLADRLSQLWKKKKTKTLIKAFYRNFVIGVKKLFAPF